MTWTQIAMLIEPDPNAPPVDDWSQFGLRQEGGYLKGDLQDLERYAEYRRELEGDDA